MTDESPRPLWMPVGLNVSGQTVLVIGGGEVAERRTRRLLEYGARVTVVAPEITPGLQQLATGGDLLWEARPAAPEDVVGAFLVVLATSDDEANRRLAEAARRSGALVNRADHAEEGDFMVPMTTGSGSLTVAVYGGGASPVFSRWLARRIEKVLGPEVEEFGGLIAEARRRVLARTDLPQPRRAELLRGLVEGDLFEILTREGREAAERRMDELLTGSSDETR